MTTTSRPRRRAGGAAPRTPRERSPKTTRPEAAERREPQRARTAAERVGRTLDALPDKVDIRDWVYQPRLAPLPDQIVNCDGVPEILDQGTEGACTGFALAAVINFQLHARRLGRRVSPRMLYEIARRYDEWPGENYDGSSARGAMKGWVRHGVCSLASWPLDRHGADHLTPEVAAESRATPGGAFYRVSHREVRDMHAALAEVGILFVTLMIHEGWNEPGPTTVPVTYMDAGNLRERELPVIERRGVADSGHAVAIVGYTPQGFIVQNSWGRGWGRDGFALLPYEDYMLHAVDVWAAQLGVPVKVDLWAAGAADTTTGIHRAARTIPLSEIRPYVIDIGNNGELSRGGDYWTTEEDLARLFTHYIPAASARWSKQRVLLYLHGGLNDERLAARRIVAFRDVLLANEIYPLHVMWESGVVDTLLNVMRDRLEGVEERAGRVSDWLTRFRDGLLEARDRTIELTLSAPGTALWNEIKENAQLASEHPRKKGGMQLLAKHARASMASMPPPDRRSWELHVVSHSAGSIFAAHAMRHFLDLAVTLKSVHFLAPAITTRLFKERVLPLVEQGACPRPDLYLLDDSGERDDDIGPYGKSLLYLVSNAFEGRRDTPLLGMERHLDHDPALRAFFEKKVDGRSGLVVAGRGDGPAGTSRSDSHTGFDSDPDTLNSMLYRVLGHPPARPFTVRDLQY